MGELYSKHYSWLGPRQASDFDEQYYDKKIIFFVKIMMLLLKSAEISMS
jgi:hypothetical protein